MSCFEKRKIRVFASRRERNASESYMHTCMHARRYVGSVEKCRDSSEKWLANAYRAYRALIIVLLTSVVDIDCD